VPDSAEVDFYHKQGNLYPPYRGIISDAVGPVDLDAATLTFRMWSTRTGELVVAAGVAQPEPATPGAFRYDWQAGETDVPGFYHAEIDVELPAGEFTFPNPGWIVIQISERGPEPPEVP
jgi:hypothetical protein